MLKLCLEITMLLSVFLLQSKGASCQLVNVTTTEDGETEIVQLMTASNALFLAKILQTHQDEKLDINECATPILYECEPGQTCVDLPKIANEMNERYYRCDEVCDPAGNDCGENANCTEIDGSYRCVCKEGYQKTGNLCKNNPISELSCGDGGEIEVKLLRNYFINRNVDPTSLHLVDPSCIGSVRGDFVIFTLKSSECGTELESRDSFLVYTNEVQNTIQWNDIVYEQAKIEISFTCSYSKHLNATISIHNLTTTYIMDSIESNGNITVWLGLFEDSEFDNVLTSNTPARVGQTLYVLANHTFAVRTYFLQLENCWLTPNSNPNERALEIIEDSKPISTSNAPVPLAWDLTSGEAEHASFAMRVVKFNDSQNLYLHCVLTLCEESSSSCERSPLEGSGRRRRNVEDKTHTFSVGPILLERPTGEDDGNGINPGVSENQESNVLDTSSMTLEVVVGVLCAALAVAIMVAFIMYRRRNTGLIVNS